MGIEVVPGTIKGDHVMLTGPVKGTVELENGTVVDVSPNVIAVTSQEEAEEIDFLIQQIHVENGHPDDREYDDDEGEVVQRPFVPVVADKFKNHPGRFKGKAAGKAAKKAASTTPSKKKD